MDLRDDVGLAPINAKELGQALEVVHGGLADGGNDITEPRHAQVGQLLVEEIDSQLLGEQGHVGDNGEADPPLTILSELNNSGKEVLAQLVKADHSRDLVQLANNVESDVGEVVFEKLEEEVE